ncbi:hypothetical protein HYV10_02440 [Candidatus Dependentiae bacterium]|nr:hypothetical protein [Candidatus Dependentiae bacterium]
MRKKIVLLLLIFANALYTKNDTDTNNNTCNDRIINLLEKQIAIQNKSNELQNQSIELLTLQVKMLLHQLEQQEQKERQLARALEEDANKPWYKKYWDTLSNNAQNVFIKLVIASITGKIVHGMLDLLDQATGDMLVKSGHPKLAIYAGTFLLEESIAGYLQKSSIKKTLADPEVKNFEILLRNFNKSNASNITKGELAREGLKAAHAAHLGKMADEYITRATTANPQSNFPNSPTTTTLQPLFNLNTNPKN